MIYYNVLNFKRPGDKDLVPAIRRALRAAGAGDRVKIPPGRYVITETIRSR